LACDRAAAPSLSAKSDDPVSTGRRERHNQSSAAAETHFSVMAGLIPAIPIPWHSRAFLNEIAGTSSAMTMARGIRVPPDDTPHSAVRVDMGCSAADRPW
jgi:hypothetical protein